MKKLMITLTVLSILSSPLAQAQSACSYVVEDTGIWDFAPGTLTLNGSEYICTISGEMYGAQSCLATDQENKNKVFTIVNDENSSVYVFTDVKDWKGSLVCEGAATVKQPQ